MALEECGRNLAQRDLLHYKRNTEHYSGNMMHDLRESLLIIARSRQVNVIDCGSTASRVLSSGLNERLNT
jgi:hypothetical protein